MKEKLDSIVERFLIDIESCDTLQKLDVLRVAFLGKAGELTTVLRGMKDVPAEERPQIGALVNNARVIIEEKIENLQVVFSEKSINETLESEKVDITEPSICHAQGALHPLSRVFNKLTDMFVELGFEVVTGPEIESEYYNFEALNIPKDHPARDMQDSFYLAPDFLLRTQTSTVQVRAMQNKKPPFKIVSPGRTYRVDNDPTHTPCFHQFEGLVVDKNVSLVDLKAMLTKMLQMLFGEKTEIRFRPSFFPFTEPSVEVDCTCPNCGGVGCTRCKGSGFMELLGAGMVNPKVLENCGIDSNEFSAFAFGPGVDRLAMVENHIPDLRMMFENDIRFLKQMK